MEALAIRFAKRHHAGRNIFPDQLNQDVGPEEIVFKIYFIF